ncbi:hypothetical protein [Litoribacillus peritrichatus]|uniref:Uncharacterized protein n=1 Tax=Litoribacillus peritrichatus TaxID=718191 RepID=A0ABP7MXS0_9GAMM
MKTILLLDLQDDSQVRTLLVASGVQVVDFNDVDNQGLVWPNLLKRCQCLLVSGADSLVDETPELEATLEPVIATGLAVEVLCTDQPLDNIPTAMISGVHYHFGIDFSSLESVELVLSEILKDGLKAKYTA